MRAALKKLPPADADIARAAEWYDDQQPGLGDGFLEELAATLRSLARNPEMNAVRFADVRCARLKRFKPYGIFYYLWRKQIIVFGVFHASRNPQTIRGRRARLN